MQVMEDLRTDEILRIEEMLLIWKEGRALPGLGPVHLHARVQLGQTNLPQLPNVPRTYNLEVGWLLP